MEVNVSNLLKVIRLSAQIIIENGGEIYRAEETIDFICKSYGVKEIEAIATPTGIYITISLKGEDTNTLVKRIRKRTIDLQKITDVNNISRKISDHSITLSEALVELDMINKRNDIEGKHSILFTGLSSAFFAVLFGGGFLEFFTALLTGILVAVVSTRFANLHSYQFFSSIISGLIIAFIAISVTSFTNIGNYNHIIVGCLMPLLPGLAMTNAIRDTIRGDLVSGIARATEVMLVASSLAAGAGIIFYLAYKFGML